MGSVIQLSRGMSARVSPEDFDRVAAFKWSATFNAIPGNRPKWYAKRKARISPGKYKTVYLHRFIMGEPAGLVIDHINGDTLDNRRENLRAVSHLENTAHCLFKKECAEDVVPF